MVHLEPAARRRARRRGRTSTGRHRYRTLRNPRRILRPRHPCAQPSSTPPPNPLRQRHPLIMRRRNPQLLRHRINPNHHICRCHTRNTSTAIHAIQVQDSDVCTPGVRAPPQRGGGGRWRRGFLELAPAPRPSASPGIDAAWALASPLTGSTASCTTRGMRTHTTRGRQDVGAMVRAFGYVLVVLFTGYLVGAVATGAVRAWLESTPMGGM